MQWISDTSKSVRNCAVCVMAALGAFGFSHTVRADDDAPYGFVWSESVDSLPKPSSMTVDANIRRLTYQAPKLPPPLANSEALVLSVCDGFGLQQVRRVSHAYPLIDTIYRFLDIYQRATQRIGQGDQVDLEHGVAAWSGRHNRMRMESAEGGNYRIVSISDGPDYDECRSERRKNTGH